MHHPDMNTHRSAEAQRRAAQHFVSANAAFEVLSDTAKRFDYDGSLFRGGGAAAAAPSGEGRRRV